MLLVSPTRAFPPRSDGQLWGAGKAFFKHFPIYSRQMLQIPEKNHLFGMSAELSDESRDSLFRGKVSLYHAPN